MSYFKQQKFTLHVQIQSKIHVTLIYDADIYVYPVFSAWM